MDTGADRLPGEPKGCTGAYEEPYGHGKNPKVGECWNCASALVMESYIPINLYWYMLFALVCGGSVWAFTMSSISSTISLVHRDLLNEVCEFELGNVQEGIDFVSRLGGLLDSCEVSVHPWVLIVPKIAVTPCPKYFWDWWYSSKLVPCDFVLHNREIDVRCDIFYKTCFCEHYILLPSML